MSWAYVTFLAAPLDFGSSYTEGFMLTKTLYTDSGPTKRLRFILPRSVGSLMTRGFTLVLRSTYCALTDFITILSLPGQPLLFPDGFADAFYLQAHCMWPEAFLKAFCQRGLWPVAAPEMIEPAT